MAAKKKGNGLTVLVLAAGQGTRLRSKTIKLLHDVAGSPMVGHVLDAARALKPQKVITVVGFQADAVRSALASRTDSFALQAEQRGTGHAVLSAAKEIRAAGGNTLLILNGDLPTLRASTLRRFVQAHKRLKASLTCLSVEIPDPPAYGRIVRDAKGRFEAIVEDKDCTPEQREIIEVNAGIYCADADMLLKVLRSVRPNNAQGEYYITDAVERLEAKGEKVAAWCHSDYMEIMGVNTREELAASARTLYARKADQLQASGVTLLDRNRTWIQPGVKVGQDTVIAPDVYLEGATRIGKDCLIRPGSRIVDSVIGDGVEIKDHCVLTDCRVGQGAQVGPFAHLRPGADLGTDARVGNFVELKKTRLGNRSKASHLSYLGDAVIGTDCNIGAGTITCNYDGENKHVTKLGKGVFIGSDTQLVAPVTLRDGAYVAAGTTVTDEVPAGALAISRTRQRNIRGWVDRKVPKTVTKKKPRG